MVCSIPPDLPENARYVLAGIFDCFAKQKVVKEGITKDILWGFEVSGHNLERVAYGLIDLKRTGYIKFFTPDNVETNEHCSNLQECWVRYEKKLLDLVYS